MVIRYDEKGKIFTEVVTKEDLPVLLMTRTQRIEGCVHVRANSRLKDALNNSERFIAVTSARVFNDQGDLQYECEFLAVNLEEVVWVTPLHAILEKSEDGGEQA